MPIDIGICISMIDMYSGNGIGIASGIVIYIDIGSAVRSGIGMAHVINISL